MRILILNDFLYPDFIGGVERRNADLALALARRGHKVTLAGFGRGPAAPGPADVRYQSLGPLGRLYDSNGKRSTLQSLRFAWRAARLDIANYDVVETASVPYVHLIPLALRCRRLRLPLLVTWYEFWGPYWKSYLGPIRAPFYRAFELLVAQLGTRAIATSRLTSGRLSARRFAGGSVPVVPCGIHLEELLSAVREENGRGEARGADLLYAGRLIPEKRLDLLLEAVALLPDVRLAIYGEGPDLGRLRQAADRLGVGARVDFRGHVADAAEVWRALVRSRIAVQPSSREGFGIFPLEAMALGVPVVFLDWPDSAVPELVRDGVEGIRSSAESPALAAAIDRVLKDDPARAALGARGRRRAAEYDWTAVAQRFEELFADLVASEVGGRSSDRSGRVRR